MAVLPVKWNWEDALDKKNQKEYRGSSNYILESLSDNISEIQDFINEMKEDIYKMQDDVSKMKSDIPDIQRRQSRLESQMRKVINKKCK